MSSFCVKFIFTIFANINLLNRLIMNAKRLILTAIVVIVGAFSIMAQDVISINAEHLNNEQKNTLQYAKKILKAQDNKVMLPLEINALLGDTIAPEPYIATPVWNDACFVSDTAFEASLIVPLKANTKNGELFSELKILGADKYTFCRVITTQISCQPNDTVTFSIDINSNINGIMLMVSVYENDVLKEQSTGISSSLGVVDCTYESNYSFDSEIFRRFQTNYKHLRDYEAETQIFYFNLLNTKLNKKAIFNYHKKIGFS